MDELFEFLVLVAERLDRAQIPYMLSGSVALSMYAQPRMTRDIDFVVDIEEGQVDKFVELFKEDCYIDRESVLEAVRARGMFNIIHEVWVIKADFVVRKDRPFRKTEFDRRRTVSIGGKDLSVVTPEDLLLSKLHWAKTSRSAPTRRRQEPHPVRKQSRLAVYSGMGKEAGRGRFARRGWSRGCLTRVL